MPGPRNAQRLPYFARSLCVRPNTLDNATDTAEEDAGHSTLVGAVSSAEATKHAFLSSIHVEQRATATIFNDGRVRCRRQEGLG